MSIGIILYYTLCSTIASIFVFGILYGIHKIIQVHRDFHKFKRDLRIGDEFEATCCDLDPFEEDIVYTIRVVDIKDDWLKYERLFKDDSKEVCTCKIEDFWYVYF